MTTQETLTRLGITELNLMQQETLQSYRKNKNLVLLSPTGSGKTLAYLLPMVQTLAKESNEVQAIVLTPSRELALQTHEVVKQMGCGIRSVAVYGGRPAMDEHRTIRGVMPQIVIGTPGRMLDHLTKENISAKGVKTLVIDEFDKCLELGFQQEMADVLSHLQNIDKRVLLSATDSAEIPRFVGTGENVTRLDYLDEDEQIPNRITLNIINSPVKDKLEILRDLLCTRGQESSIVFVGFRESVARVAKYLNEQKFCVSAFHGGMEQKDRERALFRFISGSANILVSTDLAARGLDIPELDNVIHYHLPLNEQAYIHRNGRTARWDAEGKAWMILGPEEYLPDYIQQEAVTWNRPAQIPQPSQPAWSTIYIGKGKKDKLSKGDIAGFLMKIGGLQRDEVGRIDVRDHYAYASISLPRLRETLVRVRGQKIKGMKTIIEPTQ